MPPNWTEIRKYVWSMLLSRGDAIYEKEILINIRKTFNIPHTLDDSSVLKMLVEQTFSRKDTGEPLMILFSKHHPRNPALSTSASGWLYLGPPQFSIGGMTPSVPQPVEVPPPAPTKKEIVAQIPRDRMTPEQLGMTLTERTKNLVPKQDIPYIQRKVGRLTDIDILKLSFLNKKNVLLKGPPGSGKTHAVRHFAYELGIPYVRVECHGGIEVSDLVGQWVPDSENAGKFKWVDGLLTLIVRSGGVFVADEVNALPREFGMKLHGLLDDERRLVLTEKDGEVIPAHERFMFVACMNPRAEGTRDLNEGFQDRFQVTLDYQYDKKIEEALIENPHLRDFAERTRKMVGEEIDTQISTRMLIQYEENLQLFGKADAIKIFLNKFDDEERQKVSEVFEIVVKGRDDPEQTDDEKATGLSALFG